MNEWMARAIAAETALQTMAAHREDAMRYKEEVMHLRKIVGSLVEYAEELLAEHLERYGETTKKNREWAKMLRDDIAAAKKVLQGEKEE